MQILTFTVKGLPFEVPMHRINFMTKTQTGSIKLCLVRECSESPGEILTDDDWDSWHQQNTQRASSIATPQIGTMKR